jgi:hypothetical protein
MGAGGDGEKSSAREEVGAGGRRLYDVLGVGVEGLKSRAQVTPPPRSPKRGN